MCKAGNVTEAYELAKSDFNACPQDIWTQREMGWALYYMLKTDIENKSDSDFFNHIEELTSLDLLTTATDSLIFNNVLWKLAEFVKNIPTDNVKEIDELFSLFNKYTFTPSKGYSFLLKSCLGFEAWEHLVNFFEWWNLDNLLPEDYQQFKLENGRKIMSLAERAYITYAKALLRLGDKEKIRAFLPKIEKLMEDYPDMIYPGYFCGKLMLATGMVKEDALNIVMPFVRKKQSEFWIWQLLSEIYKEDADTCLACLLRAVHCKTQEVFLGKVRMQLASIYLLRKDYCRAKFHIDKITQCYVKQGWHLPYKVQNWLREPWMQQATMDDSDSLDYKRITDSILSYGTNESLAVVTYVNAESKRVAIVYGEKKRAMVKLHSLNVKVTKGTLLKIHWLPNKKEGIDIVSAEPTGPELSDNTYIKRINGSIVKSAAKPFAFMKEQGINCFITPMMVQKYNLKGGEKATVLAVYDYNKKRAEWAWTCISVFIKQRS